MDDFTPKLVDPKMIISRIISWQNASHTQFLYRVPPKLPPCWVYYTMDVGYNMYEKKALAFAAFA
jgi:hypothetical protein